MYLNKYFKYKIGGGNEESELTEIIKNMITYRMIINKMLMIIKRETKSGFVTLREKTTRKEIKRYTSSIEDTVKNTISYFTFSKKPKIYDPMLNVREETKFYMKKIIQNLRELKLDIKDDKDKISSCIDKMIELKEKVEGKESRYLSDDISDNGGKILEKVKKDVESMNEILNSMKVIQKDLEVMKTK